MRIILETQQLTKRFGAVVAADKISVCIYEGERIGIIGANGAGKTTFINIVTGYVKPDQGRILFRGEDITHKKPRDITRKGIVRSFQMPQLYSNLTVLENVLIALAVGKGRDRVFWTSLKNPMLEDNALELLERFHLTPYVNKLARELPEGVRKVVDIAMSVSLNPQILMLDEPTSGVSSKDKFEIMNTLIEALSEAKITILFVEHDMDIVHEYAERVLMFSNGRIVLDGPPDEVSAKSIS